MKYYRSAGPAQRVFALAQMALEAALLCTGAGGYNQSRSRERRVPVTCGVMHAQRRFYDYREQRRSGDPLIGRQIA
jgi:hypothetical protein